MSWISQAISAVTGPFKRRPSQAQAAAQAAARRPRTLQPDSTQEINIKFIFSLTNPGIIRPDQAIEALGDEKAAEIAQLVLEHFRDKRPEMASFPSLATQVIDVAEHPDADLTRLSRLIDQDPAISMKVLQTANSAMYRREREVTSVRLAITQLGLSLVANVAVGVACRSLFDVETRLEHDLFPTRWTEQFQHSMTTAFAASNCSLQRRAGTPEQAFLGGMFHDIGKSLALRSLASLMLAGKIGPISEERIDRVLEKVHVEVGSLALQQWELPSFLYSTCLHHHDDKVPVGSEYTDLHTIRIVSGLNVLRIRTNFDEGLVREVRRSAMALGMTEQQLRALNTQVREYAEQVAEMFTLKG